MSSITETVSKKLKLFRKDKVFTFIDGSYDSLFQGKGVEIDSLREYVVGDSIKDIDWAATARTGTTHSKQYIASRDQRLLIVPDISGSLMLPGHTDINKRDALYGIVALLGAFSVKNRDVIAMCWQEADGSCRFSRYNSTRNHVESLMQTIEKAVAETPQSSPDLSVLLQAVAASAQRQTAVFIITDGLKDLGKLDMQFRRLAGRHKLFFIQLAPSSPLLKQTDELLLAIDVETQSVIQQQLLRSPKLAKEWQVMASNYVNDLSKLCRKHGVAFTYVTDEDATTDAVKDLFNQAKTYARRRN